MTRVGCAIELAALVIGDAEEPARVALDEVDRTAQFDAAFKFDGIGHRARIGLASETMPQPE